MLEHPAEPLPLTPEASSPFADAGPSNGFSRTEEPAQGQHEPSQTVEKVKAEQRAERAAKIISLASLLLLFVAVALYTSISYFGWNPYLAAIALFCAGIAGYPLLALLTHAVASQTSRAFKSLSPSDRLQWAQKVPSMLHATTLTITGLNVVLQAHRAGDGLLHGRNELVAAFLGLELAYLLQDTGMEVLKQARFGRSHSLLRWGHHIALLALLPAYYWRPQADPLLGLFFLCNAATIPRQLRWYFQMVGMKRRRLWYRLNTLALFTTFASTHILSVLYLLYEHCRSQHLPWHQIPYRVKHEYLVAGAVIVTFNSYWLWSLLKDSSFRRKASQKTS
ncbi:hypothetical protein COCOBI_10-1450 [Coccomyxa sp. Obi]|nr:hypothetical protein COCOBI_10-1450 [Coccomyxa sp. Obi]